MRAIFPTILCLAFLAGCATNQPVNYYYGNYSKALYLTKKDETPKSLAKYKAMLEEIIEVSQKKDYRVPPGIYCEYGYLLAKEGDPSADRYFELELQTYPESEQFVSFLRAQLTKEKS